MLKRPRLKHSVTRLKNSAKKKTAHDHSEDMEKGADNLNPRQRRFAEEFTVDFNATLAAQRAGFAKNSAHVAGHRMVKNANVMRLVRKNQEKLSKATQITAERVVNKLAEIAFSDTDPQLPKPSDQLNALQQLGKHLGLFVEKHEVNSRVAILNATVSAEDLRQARELVESFQSSPPLQIEAKAVPDTESEG